MRNRLMILAVIGAALPFAMAMNRAPASEPIARDPKPYVFVDEELLEYWPYEDPSVIGGCITASWDEI